MTSPLFWVCAGGFLLLALVLLLAPVWREQARSGRRSPAAVLGTLAVAPVALGLYFLVSSYDAELDYLRGPNPADLAVLEQLAARLGTNPDDPVGWALLGRSYLELGEYGLARQALQEAWSRTAVPDAALKLSYAESMLLTEPATALNIAGELVDEVLENAPDNQRALWWGGLVAVERGQTSLAVERWSALLATNPPPELADLLREQIVALAGTTDGAATGGAATSGATVPVASADGPVVAIEIVVAPEMPVAALGPNAIVYLLARAPGGGPPLAARQIPLSALPGRFELGVADAMISGRTIAGQDRVTIIARISLSGEPTEQPGDIFGQAEVDVASGELIRITIDSIVPSA